jgi:hypothetical protein
VTAPTPPTPNRAGGGSDWPAQATDAIVNLVDSVKDRTTGPATKLARGLVYGTLFTLVGTAALVLLLVLLVRGIDVGVDALLDLADADDPGRSTWIAHTVTGLLFLLPGLLLWRKGTRAATSD